MKTNKILSMLMLVLSTAMIGTAYAQTIARKRAHFDDQNRLICTCGTPIIKHNITACEVEKHGISCVVKVYGPCSKCKKTWRAHLSGSHVNEISEVYSAYAEKTRKHINAIPNECYTVDSMMIPSKQLMEYTIRAKCDLPLYCTIDGKTYLVEKGYPRSYIEEFGKRKEVRITHRQPAGGTAIYRE